MFPITDKMIQDNKIQFIQISEAEQAVVTKIQAGQADAWAAEQEKPEFPPTSCLTDYRAVIAKYTKQQINNHNQ